MKSLRSRETQCFAFNFSSIINCPGALNIVIKFQPFSRSEVPKKEFFGQIFFGNGV